jgi:hypothetical protein
MESHGTQWLKWSRPQLWFAAVNWIIYGFIMRSVTQALTFPFESRGVCSNLRRRCLSLRSRPAWLPGVDRLLKFGLFESISQTLRSRWSCVCWTYSLRFFAVRSCYCFWSCSCSRRFSAACYLSNSSASFASFAFELSGSLSLLNKDGMLLMFVISSFCCLVNGYRVRENIFECVCVSLWVAEWICC